MLCSFPPRPAGSGVEGSWSGEEELPTEDDQEL